MIRGKTLWTTWPTFISAHRPKGRLLPNGESHSYLLSETKSALLTTEREKSPPGCWESCQDSIAIPLCWRQLIFCLKVSHLLIAASNFFSSHPAFTHLQKPLLRTSPPLFPSLLGDDSWTQSWKAGKDGFLALKTLLGLFKTLSL